MERAKRLSNVGVGIEKKWLRGALSSEKGRPFEKLDSILLRTSPQENDLAVVVSGE